MTCGGGAHRGARLRIGQGADRGGTVPERETANGDDQSEADPVAGTAASDGSASVAVMPVSAPMPNILMIALMITILMLATRVLVPWGMMKSRGSVSRASQDCRRER